MEYLLKGVSAFQRDVFPHHKECFESLADGQSPQALFITCADSRIMPAMITQSRPGDLFICRNAGNMVPPYGEVTGGVSATIEYAVSVLNVKDIIICGHMGCGAVAAMQSPEKLQNMPSVRAWLSLGEIARRVVTENYPEATGDTLLHLLTEENVVSQLAHLRTHPSVAARLAAGKLRIHGWVYYIRTGQVDVWDEGRGRFVPVQEYTPASYPPRKAVAANE